MVLIMLWFESHVCFVKHPGDIYEASSLSDFFKYKKNWQRCFSSEPFIEIIL